MVIQPPIKKLQNHLMASITIRLTVVAIYGYA